MQFYSSIQFHLLCVLGKLRSPNTNVEIAQKPFSSWANFILKENVSIVNCSRNSKVLSPSIFLL